MKKKRHEISLKLHEEKAKILQNFQNKRKEA